MSVKTTYKCDVCRDEKGLQVLFGIRFLDLKHFKLGHPQGHEGVHICLGCVEQIAKQYPGNAARPAWAGAP